MYGVFGQSSRELSHRAGPTPCATAQRPVPGDRTGLTPCACDRLAANASYQKHFGSASSVDPS
eukprot:1554825-Heterocapsa_arctica.AAC.2